MNEVDKELNEWKQAILDSNGKTYSNNEEFCFSATYSQPIDARKKMVFISYE